MSQAFAPIIALLLGTAFLLAGSGLHGLLLPLRGQAEGFSTTSLGLLGTAFVTVTYLPAVTVSLLRFGRTAG